MRTRDAVLAYQEQQSSDNSSKTIDLDLVDPVSALVFEFEATNGTTSNVQNPFPYVVTKIEVVDGSDVLAALSFPQMQALHFYKTQKQPELREDEVGGSGQVMGTSLLFGRHLYDLDYALDLTRFKNPQLKISWNLGVTRTVSATTAFATGTFKISAIAKCMEGMGAAPSKFLMQKEIESWTGATSGDKRIEFPTDYVYRMLMLRTYLRSIGSVNDVDECVNKIKLTADTDKFIAFERYTKQFRAEMAQVFGTALVWKRFTALHGDELWFEVNLEPQLKLIPTVVNRAVGYGWCWSGAAALLFGDTAGGTVGTRERVDGQIEGFGLHHAIPIPLGLMDKPETWFDPKTYKKLELVCTQGRASANSVVAEQVRPL